MRSMYIIVKCYELGDQWECDADRRPYMITLDWVKAMSFGCGYEVYETDSTGRVVKCIKDYYDD